MSRISREQMWMDMCEVAARRATCFRGNSGAMVIKNNDVLATGYNGPPPGHPHCKGSTCELTPQGGCMRSVHAEVNAINRALEKVQTLLRSCDMYTLHSPCAPCADLIIKSGLKRVYYRHPYRLRDGLNMLMEPRHGIEVFRVTQAGMVINERTNELVMEK